MTRILCTLALGIGPGLAWGQWQLDPQRSTVAFVSTKNSAVAEVSHFEGLSGSIDDHGVARIEIELDSVQTLIPIRNERMREFLFETADFPTASITSQIDRTDLNAAYGAELVDMEIELTLDLHGHSQTLRAPVTVVARNGHLHVSSRQPVVINAADFELAGGLVKLKEIAGLASISTAVPVTVNLFFPPGG